MKGFKRGMNFLACDMDPDSVRIAKARIDGAFGPLFQDAGAENT